MNTKQIMIDYDKMVENAMEHMAQQGISLNSGTFPDPRANEREWWCYSTCLIPAWLMLECRATGAEGVVKESTSEEWSWAFDCPSNPKRWMDNSRVTVMKEGEEAYSALLRDPRWIAFRLAFIERQRDESGDVICVGCYDDMEDLGADPIHVHHTVYRDGAMPWEYRDSDLRLYCKRCHERIHEAEKITRDFVRALTPTQADEVYYFIEELQRCVKQRAGLVDALRASRHAVSDYIRVSKGLLPFWEQMAENYAARGKVIISLDD